MNRAMILLKSFYQNLCFFGKRSAFKCHVRLVQFLDPCRKDKMTIKCLKKIEICDGSKTHKMTNSQTANS